MSVLYLLDRGMLSAVLFADADGVPSVCPASVGNGESVRPL